MNKIPVGATIAHAYRFVFANALTVFKAIWLPLLASLAVFFLFTRRTALFLAAVQAHDPSAVSLFGPLLLLGVLLVIFYFAQFTAATEAALGRPPQSWVAFHFDKTMWRLLAGFLGAMGALAILCIIAMIMSLAIGTVLDMAVKAAPVIRPAVAIAAVLLVLLFCCILFFVAFRFLFLLGPVNVSEQRLGLRRSWELSAHNFWRILLITLAITVPVGIVNQIIGFSLGGFPPTLPAGASKAARDAAETAWQIARLNAMADRWYLTLPLTGLVMWFQLGAGCAAQAFAYRKLTEDAASAPVAGHGLPD
jgi:hypothetical protein